MTSAQVVEKSVTSHVLELLSPWLDDSPKCQINGDENKYKVVLSPWRNFPINMTASVTCSLRPYVDDIYRQAKHPSIKNKGTTHML